MSQKITFTLLLLSLAIGGNYAVSVNSDPHFVADHKVIVHLMEWKYADIAKECEVFLGPYGYGGVQVSPVNENAVLARREWWERYQPVGYKIVTRSGDEAQFKDMVGRCNKAGVRIYVDVVLNHMTMPEVGKGTAGDDYDGKVENYPGVPFTAADFHGHESCGTDDLNIHNVENATEARVCQMGGLRDLNQGRENVRAAQVAFLNTLIDIGVAGFRADASKHQWPADMQNIISRLHTLNTNYFPKDSHSFWYHEVPVTGTIKAEEYLPFGRVIEFKYWENMGNVFRKLHDQKMVYLKNFAYGWGMLNDQDALVMIDNHDLQRGHIGDLRVSIAWPEHRLLKMSTSFMLALPYAVTRVMSSYFWPRNIVDNRDTNDWMGPPTYPNGTIMDVKTNADMSCAHEWVCEHRWRQIYNMAKFRVISGDEKMANWWDNGNNAIGFGRGDKAYYVINNDDHPLSAKIQTGLPGGTYCDVIDGDLVAGKCTGRFVTVDSSGIADIYIDNAEEDPMLAFHIKSKV